MNGRYLDSSDPLIRRASAVVYAIATGVAVATWLLLGGSSAVDDSDWGSATAWHLVALPVWWVAAGVGLRIVRRFDQGDPGAPSR